MQHAAVEAHSPERRRAQFLRGGRAAVLDDSISCADVVEEEVAIGVDDFIAEGVGNDERAAVDDRACGRGNDGGDVASVAADLLEDRGPGQGVRCVDEIRVACGRFGGAHESGEVVDVGHAVGVRMIFRILSRFAKGGYVLRVEAAGDAHFVQIGVGGKREQAGVLIFPAEARDTSLARRFEYGDLNHLAADGAICVFALLVGDVHDGGAGDGFDEAVAERVERSAQGADVSMIRHVLLDFVLREGGTGANGAVVDERTICNGDRSVANGDIWIGEITPGINVADAEFGGLADSANSRALMAFAAGLRVEYGAETFGDIFDFGEDAFVHTESGAVHEAVRLIVEARGSFGWGSGGCGENVEGAGDWAVWDLMRVLLRSVAVGCGHC